MFNLLSLAIVNMAGLVSAKNYSDSYYPYEFFPWPYKRQYASWWPKSWWAEQLNQVTANECRATFHDYNVAYDSGPGSSAGSLLYSICYQHAACLLDNLDTDIVANYQSASVVLGLMPSMLSMAGPTLAEVALLSQHRPLLSLLISVAAPAMWPSRPGVIQNPTDVLLEGSRGRTSNFLDRELMKPRSGRYGAWLSAVEYILLLGAVANVIELSWEIGFKSVSTFRCTNQYLIFLWVMLALAVHSMTVLAVAMRKRLPQPSTINADNTDPQLESSHTMAMHPIGPPKQGASYSLLSQDHTVIIGGPLKRGILSKWRNEFKPCILHTHCRCLDEVSEAGFFSTGFNFAAGCCSNIHFIVGVIIFSSLQFISVLEVCQKILWRFVVSTAVCRIIMIVEVTAIRNHTVAR